MLKKLLTSPARPGVAHRQTFSGAFQVENPASGVPYYGKLTANGRRLV